MSAPIQENPAHQEMNGGDVHQPNDLEARLSSLAVLHETPIDKWETIVDANGEFDRSAGQYYDRTVHENLPGRLVVENALGGGTYHEAHKAAGSEEKSRALRAMREAITTGAEGASDPEGKTDWQAVSGELFKRAVQVEDDEQKNTLFVGSVISAQFAPAREAREGLMRSAYELGVQGQVAEACKNSHLVVLIGGPNAPGGEDRVQFASTTVHPVRRYAPAFEIDPERAAKYLQHINKGIPEGVPRPGISLKKLQKTLTEKSQAGEQDDDLRSQAEDASVYGEKIGETMLDIYKLERFALEQQYIHEQAKDVLAGSDWEHSALAKELEYQRTVDNTVQATDMRRYPSGRRPVETLDDALAKLNADIGSAFESLSEPSIAKFSLEGADLNNPASLTAEQLAALRFRTVRDYTAQHVALSQYLDFENFLERRENQVIHRLGGSEVWSASQDGAASSEAATQVVGAIAYAANAPEILEADDKPSADQLAELAHSKRRLLLTAATHHIEELNEAQDGEEIIGVTHLESDPEADPDDADPEMVEVPNELTRDGDGQWQLAMKSNIPMKESMELYSAALLGCPALREIHENRGLMSVAEKAAYGSSNYIDHILAAVINEAKARGIFTPGRYPLERGVESAPANQPDDLLEV